MHYGNSDGYCPAKIETVADIYQVVWTAVATKRPIEARYQEHPRLFCPHRLGRNREGQLRVLRYQYGGESESGLQPPGSQANWRCLRWRSSLRLDYWRIGGAQRPTTPVLLPAWSMPISTLRIRQSAIHKEDSKGVGQTGCELSPLCRSGRTRRAARSEVWRWRGD